MAIKHDKPIPRTTTGKGKNYNATDKGAGMTAKGRAEYNAKNNANLKAPAPNPKTKADEGRKKSFCARRLELLNTLKATPHAPKHHSKIGTADGY